MKSILEYLKNSFIGDSLINESFKCTYLREISKQFNERIKQNHIYNAKDSYNDNDTESTFKYVFNPEAIAWSELTDDMFYKYTKDDKEGVSKVKGIMSNRKNHFDGIVILLSDTEPKYRGMFIGTSYDNRYYSFTSSLSWKISYKSIKPGDVEEFLTKEFLVADITKLETFDKRRERSSAKFGTFNLFNDDNDREKEYKEIARKNVERYRQYVAKVKAQKDMNDGMAEKVMEYVNKIMSITTKFSADPIKYAKYEYEVGYLLDSISDKKSWVNSRSSRGGGYYSGSNGLLTVYKEYIKCKLSLAKGNSYDYERKEYENKKKELESLFSKLDEKIEKFNEE